MEDRIVSLSQPWIRPIVRGESKAPTEFGAKISVSVVNGYTFMDRLSFDAYNEGEANEFINVIEAYRRRFGCYPLRVLADKIYRSRNNRTFCILTYSEIVGNLQIDYAQAHSEIRSLSTLLHHD